MATMARWAGALLLALVAACAPMAIDEAGARHAATGFIMRSAPLGTSIEDIEVDTVRQETRGPVAGWAVEVHGTAVTHGETDGTIRAYWLFIDGMTGEVTIEAQG